MWTHVDVAVTQVAEHVAGSEETMNLHALLRNRAADGERLDGEGGYAVYGRLMPAEDSTALGALPIGLAQGVSLRNAVAKGEMVKWSDVTIDERQEPVRLRREMERQLLHGSDEFADEAAHQGIRTSSNPA